MKKPFSIVIPIFNEEENIFYLIKRIKKLLNISSKKCEVIAVNDGSTDKTLDLLKKEISKNKFLRIIDLKTNHGQTAAIMAGLNYCTNDIIIIMDSDLQNDPDDIPNLIRKIDEGYDVVSGWRKNRKDPFKNKEDRKEDKIHLETLWFNAGEQEWLTKKEYCEDNIMSELENGTKKL